LDTPLEENQERDVIGFMKWSLELLIESNSLGICTGTHSFQFSTSFLNRKPFSVWKKKKRKTWTCIPAKSKFRCSRVIASLAHQAPSIPVKIIKVELKMPLNRGRKNYLPCLGNIESKIYKNRYSTAQKENCLRERDLFSESHFMSCSNFSLSSLTSCISPLPSFPSQHRHIMPKQYTQSQSARPSATGKPPHSSSPACARRTSRKRHSSPRNYP